MGFDFRLALLLCVLCIVIEADETALATGEFPDSSTELMEGTPPGKKKKKGKYFKLKSSVCLPVGRMIA
ncbi:hypothetical protein CRM22_007815 [Opisthorchis felineus]|uniref:Uncharacterized protein n=1 Tax=Opisthorchis felineus TaxID=147828 RepID=A0A4S2LE06_OPIFE|nr:hypothetical protein CRM22_007815 [Opisthorchis felineus]